MSSDGGLPNAPERSAAGLAGMCVIRAGIVEQDAEQLVILQAAQKSRYKAASPILKDGTRRGARRI